MDWIQDFVKKFAVFPELRNLRQERFHGGVTINFSNGVPSAYDFKLHRRAKALTEAEVREIKKIQP